MPVLLRPAAPRCLYGASMWRRVVNVSEAERARFEHDTSRPIVWRERDKPPGCCGKLMEPRLARAHDRLGQTLFVAVWQCPVCGRVTY